MTPPLNAAVLEPLNTGALPAHWNRGIDKAAIDRAIARALDGVDRNLAHFGDAFPMPSSQGGVYQAMDNTEWTNGFWTGMLWLAYELTGAARYRDAALRHVASFHARQPVGKLDRMFVTPDIKVVESGVHHSPLARNASDHLPVWARIRIG